MIGTTFPEDASIPEIPCIYSLIEVKVKMPVTRTRGVKRGWERNNKRGEGNPDRKHKQRENRIVYNNIGIDLYKLLSSN